MTKRSKASLAARATKKAIAQAVPDANRILFELSRAFPERATNEKALIAWVEGLDVLERERLVQRMIVRIARGITKPEATLKTLVDTGELRGFSKP